MSKTLKVVNGDLVRPINNTGYTTVEAGEKCRQDVQCILGTNYRRSTGLGAQLDELIGTERDNGLQYDGMPAAYRYQSRIRQALTRLKQAQREHQFSYRTPSELIERISPVRIWPVQDDPRNFRWRVDIRTVYGRNNFSVVSQGRA